MRRYLLLLTMALFFSTCDHTVDFSDVKISGLRIWTGEFISMIDITNPGDIDRFKALLIGAAMTRDTDSDWDYRFDIDAERYAGRWLYSTKTGRMASLNYRLSPRLILRDREGLNRFITDMRKKYK